MIIYLLNADSTFLYKIGITKNKTKLRIKQLSTGSAYKINLIWEYETEYGRDIESIIHRHYAYCQNNLEWFDFSEVPIHKVIEKIKKIEKTIIQLKENKNE